MNEEKINEFCMKVQSLAEKYDIDMHMVVEHASVTRLKHSTPSVLESKAAHLQWELNQFNLEKRDAFKRKAV